MSNGRRRPSGQFKKPPGKEDIDALFGRGLGYSDWEREIKRGGFEWTPGLKNTIISLEWAFFKEEIERLNLEPNIANRKSRTKSNSLESILKRLKGEVWVKGHPSEKQKRLDERRLLGKDAKIRCLQTYADKWGLKASSPASQASPLTIGGDSPHGTASQSATPMPEYSEFQVASPGRTPAAHHDFYRQKVARPDLQTATQGFSEATTFSGANFPLSLNIPKTHSYDYKSSSNHEEPWQAHEYPSCFPDYTAPDSRIPGTDHLQAEWGAFSDDPEFAQFIYDNDPSLPPQDQADYGHLRYKPDVNSIGQDACLIQPSPQKPRREQLKAHSPGIFGIAPQDLESSNPSNRQHAHQSPCDGDTEMFDNENGLSECHEMEEHQQTCHRSSRGQNTIQPRASNNKKPARTTRHIQQDKNGYRIKLSTKLKACRAENRELQEKNAVARDEIRVLWEENNAVKDENRELREKLQALEVSHRELVTEKIIQDANLKKQMLLSLSLRSAPETSRGDNADKRRSNTRQSRQFTESSGPVPLWTSGDSTSSSNSQGSLENITSLNLEQIGRRGNGLGSTDTPAAPNSRNSAGKNSAGPMRKLASRISNPFLRKDRSSPAPLVPVFPAYALQTPVVPAPELVPPQEQLTNMDKRMTYDSGFASLEPAVLRNSVVDDEDDMNDSSMDTVVQLGAYLDVE